MRINHQQITLKLIEAAIGHQRSLALGQIAVLETLLGNPEAADIDNYVEQIVEHASKLTEYENCMNTLNKYFVAQANTPQAENRPPAAPTPKPPPPQETPPPKQGAIKEEQLADISPTYRKSLKEKFNDTE